MRGNQYTYYTFTREDEKQEYQSINGKIVRNMPSSSSWLPRGRGPVITFVAVVGATVGAVAYSHYAQVRDKNVMREGVERDKERLRFLRKQRKQQQKQQQEAVATTTDATKEA